ncbi:hypothetical protein NECAME_14099 [Necator americanus]|uniref:G-protein coupled receptors family 1 profile domain-containing protein n=1 Tax=Necator americanus TaxID=51031 RepID=W2SQL3_NECAM|nr:hypothetical protein NECAME_14099 [Necator americanus]ETN71768.1 hypothetical protein NECAME_14099 [Necator americanus]
MTTFALNMYLYLLEGSIVCLSNGVLMLCILGSKNNRKRREFLLIISQAVADTIYAIAFMLIAVHRLKLEAAGMLKAMFSRWECALHPALILHDIATPLLGLVPMAMSINFLVSSVIPLWYITSGIKYTSLLLSEEGPVVRRHSDVVGQSGSVPYLVTGVLLVANYIMLWNDEIPTSALCIAANGASHPIPYGIMLGIRIIANIGSAAVYLSIVIYLSSTTMNFLIYIMRYRELRSILIRSVFGRIPIVKYRLSDSSSAKKPTPGRQSQVASELTTQRRMAPGFLRGSEVRLIAF